MEFSGNATVGKFMKNNIFTLMVMICLCSITSCGTPNLKVENNIDSSEISENSVQEDELKEGQIQNDDTDGQDVEPYLYEVKSIKETRMDGKEINDFYITNIGNPDNVYYIDENKTLWGGGKNQYGQLGNGRCDDMIYDPMIVIAENVIHVDFSRNGYIVFLTKDGDLFGMGTYATGGLLEPIKTTIYENWEEHCISSPKLLMKKVKYARCSETDVVVIREDDTVWSWGRRYLEDGTSCMENTPVKVLKDAVLVTGGKDNHSALLKDGTVWTWGNFNKELCFYKPVLLAENIKMVWTGDLQYNINCENVNEFGGIYDYDSGGIIVQTKDGTLFKCDLERNYEIDYSGKNPNLYHVIFQFCEFVEPKFTLYNDIHTYDAVLEEYERAWNEQDSTNENGRYVSEFFPQYSGILQNSSKKLFYTIIDLSGDGTKELLIGSMYDDEYNIFDMFSYHDGEIVNTFGISNQLIEVWRLCEGGVIKVSRDSGPYSYYWYFKMFPEMAVAEMIESISFNFVEHKYYNSIKGEDIEITKEEFESIRSKYQLIYNESEWKELKGFWN